MKFLPRHKSNLFSPDISMNQLVSVIVGAVIATMTMSLLEGITGITTRARTFLHRGRKGRADRALLSTSIPLPNLNLEDGSIIAFRVWEIAKRGRHLWLQSPLHTELSEDANPIYHEWKVINFADDLPTPDNSHGFYGIRIDPITLFDGAIRNHLSEIKSQCWGLVELRGTVIEHEDGTFRGECAKPLCIWITSANSELYRTIPRLHRIYPTIPIFVCTREQVIRALFTIAMRAEWQRQ